MSFIDQWRQEVSESLTEAAKLAPLAPDVDLKYELMVIGVLWPVRQPVQDFDFEAMSAVQEVVGSQAKHTLRLVQDWDDDRLVAARALAAQAPRDAEFETELKTLIKHFGAFPIFAKQLASQARAAAAPRKVEPKPKKPVASPRVFVYYEPSDGQGAAATVRQTLQRKDIPVWDDLMPQAGQRDWWHLASRAVQEVDFLLLVMTHAAVESDMVRRLWRLARQSGVCIYPVTQANEINFGLLPRWIRQVHFYNLQLEWPKLIRSLKGKCQTPRTPFMADDLPGDFVARPAELAEIVSYLYDRERDEAITATVGIHSAGGYGKTTLAMALCHNEDIRQVFDNGILWITLGEEPGDLSRYVVDLIEMLSGERPGFTGLDAAVVRLGELLADREILLVIDDVWQVTHLKPFLQGGANVARIITTRNINLLPLEANAVGLGAMRTKEAVQLLQSQLPAGEPATMQKLAARMGGWPLLLRLTNGALRDRISNKQQTLDEAIDFVSQALSQHGLMAFDQHNSAARSQAVSKTIEMSLELLNQQELARFKELMVFPEEIDIPLATVEKLWAVTGGFDDFDTEELADRLHALSLLSKLDLTTRQIRLHKVMHNYLAYACRAQLPHFHQQLLQAHRPASSRWAQLSPEEPYLWNYLAYHLISASQTAELTETVQMLDYLAAKTALKGVYYAELDLRLAEKVDPANDTLKTLRRALSQASHLLSKAKTPHQVMHTLHSRIAHLPALVDILATAEPTLPHPLLTARHSLPDLPDSRLIRTLWGHSAGVLAVAVSASGQTAISVDKDNNVFVWRTDIGEANYNFNRDGAEIWACDLSADGSVAALADADGRVVLWDMAAEKERLSWTAHQAAIMGCALTADGQMLVTASKDETLKVWDASTGVARQTLTGHTRTVTDCDITPEGDLIVSASNDGGVRLWETKSGQSKFTLTIQETRRGIDRLTFMSQRTAEFRCAISDDGSAIAGVSGEAGILAVWDVTTGNQRFAITGEQRGLENCALNSNGTSVIGALNTGAVKVWDALNGAEIATLADHARTVNSCAISADGHYIVSASDDKTVKVWDGKSEAARLDTLAYQQPANGCAISADGSVAVSAMGDNTLRVWDVATGRERLTLSGHTRKVNGCAISLDGSTIVSASQDQTLIVWDARTGQKRAALSGHTWSVNNCVIDANLATIISASDDSTLKVWDVATATEKFTLTGHGRAVSDCAISANGYVAVSSSGDSTLKLWNPHTGDLRATLKGHRAWVNRCTVSADGSTVVSGSFDKTLKVWDVRSATERLTLAGHGSSVTGCAISADGRLVVSASRDKSIAVWNAQNGQALATLFVDAPLLDCACAADGRTIVAVSTAGVYFLRFDP